MTLREYERGIITKTLEETGGSHKEAARRLGISRRTVQNKLRGYKDTLVGFTDSLPQRRTKRGLFENLSKDNLKVAIEKLEELLQCAVLEHDKRYGGEAERLNRYVDNAVMIREAVHSIEMEG